MHGRQRVEDAHIADLVPMRVDKAVLHAVFLYSVDEIRALLVAHAAYPEGAMPHRVDSLATCDRMRHPRICNQKGGMAMNSTPQIYALGLLHGGLLLGFVWLVWPKRK